MNPTAQWLAQREEKAALLASPVNLTAYFEMPDVHGKPLHRFEVGTVSLPTGQVLVKDPIHGLAETGQPYHVDVPAGEHPVTVAAVKTEFDCDRYAAVRVTFSPAPAATYELALVGDEDLSTLVPDGYFGFTVKKGLAAIFDRQSAEAAAEFAAAFQAGHPGADLYADYFAPLLSQKASADCGDWLRWTVPGTDYHVPIFQSGFGNGNYPVYLGRDASGNVCCLVVHLIDVEFEFGETEGMVI
ncbi:MAG: DUF4241 domain-containing protein [Clostridiales bacterium]|nr:DUF4241 domain-containing protein [Clostridiales bacterium]